MPPAGPGCCWCRGRNYLQLLGVRAKSETYGHARRRPASAAVSAVYEGDASIVRGGRRAVVIRDEELARRQALYSRRVRVPVIRSMRDDDVRGRGGPDGGCRVGTQVEGDKQGSEVRRGTRSHGSQHEADAPTSGRPVVFLRRQPYAIMSRPRELLLQPRSFRVPITRHGNRGVRTLRVEGGVH